MTVRYCYIIAIFSLFFSGSEGLWNRSKGNVEKICSDLKVVKMCIDLDVVKMGYDRREKINHVEALMNPVIVE